MVLGQNVEVLRGVCVVDLHNEKYIYSAASKISRIINPAPHEK